MNALLRLKLLKKLKAFRLELSQKPIKLVARLSALKGIKEVRKQLSGQSTVVQIDPVIDLPKDAPVKKTLSTRQKLNNAAIDALAKIEAGEASKDDPVIREALKGYSGSGGGLMSSKGEKGSPHEYYTPKPVAQAMWGVWEGLGFSGGKVLDPSAGMGIFAQTKPKTAAVEQVELDYTSGQINSILNDSDSVEAHIGSVEYQKPLSKFGGAFNVASNQYARVLLTYKGTVQRAISDEKQGLQGRVFDGDTKQWIFPFGEVIDSKSKKIATMNDFLVFLSDRNIIKKEDLEKAFPKK